MRRWPSKDPEEYLDYGFLWANSLEDGETIAASTFTVVSGSVTKSNESVDTGASITKLWLAGGTLDETCVVLNHVTTSLGREYEQSARIRIRSK